MSDLYGAPSGQSAAEADIWAARLNSLAVNKGNVELQSAQITLQNQQKMQQMMQGQQLSSNPEDITSNLDNMAQIAFKSGNFEQGKQYATAASTIRKNASDIESKQSTMKSKNVTMFANLLQGVHDQNSWQQANALYQIESGEASPFAKLPYNPQLVSQLQTKLVSAKDQSVIDLNKARTKAEEAAAADSRARVPLIKAQTQITKDRDAALGKVGVKPPTAAAITAITDQILQDYDVDSTDANQKADLRILARPIAERAADLQKTSNITASQAATRAYQEAKAGGTFKGFGINKGDAGSAKRPIEVPMDGTKIDAKKLKENKYYNIGGKSYLWTGKAFVPSGSGPGEVEETSADRQDRQDEEDKDNEEENPDDTAEAQ